MPIGGWAPAKSFQLFTANQSLTFASAGTISISTNFLSETSKQARCGDYGKVGAALVFSQSSGAAGLSITVTWAHGPLQTSDTKMWVSVATASATCGGSVGTLLTSAVYGANQNCPGWFALSAVSIAGDTSTGTLIFNDYNIAHAY